MDADICMNVLTIGLVNERWFRFQCSLSISLKCERHRLNFSSTLLSVFRRNWDFLRRISKKTKLCPKMIHTLPHSPSFDFSKRNESCGGDRSIFPFEFKSMRISHSGIFKGREHKNIQFPYIDISYSSNRSSKCTGFSKHFENSQIVMSVSKTFSKQRKLVQPCDSN